MPDWLKTCIGPTVAVIIAITGSTIGSWIAINSRTAVLEHSARTLDNRISTIEQRLEAVRSELAGSIAETDASLMEIRESHTRLEERVDGL